MGIFSLEEAKTKLTECNILLKYMSFLQKNGFSDCGKGQVLGQVSLLQEYLESYADNQGNGILASQQREESEESTQVPKGITSRQNYLTPSPLHGENGEVDRPIRLRGNEDEFKTEKLEIQASQQLARLATDDTTNKLNGKVPNSMQTARSEIKEMTGSWFEKIKRITEIEEWR